MGGKTIQLIDKLSAQAETGTIKLLLTLLAKTSSNPQGVMRQMINIINNFSLKFQASCVKELNRRTHP